MTTMPERPPPSQDAPPTGTIGDLQEWREQSQMAAPPPSVVSVTLTRRQAEVLLAAAERDLEQSGWVPGDYHKHLLGATGILSVALGRVPGAQTGGGDA